MSRVALSPSKAKSTRKPKASATPGAGRVATNSQQLAEMVVNMFGSRGGAVVNPETAMRVGTVYACVRILAESVALLPLRIMKTEGEETKPDRTHPLDKLFRLRPSPAFSSFEYKRLAMVQMLLAGNHYSKIRRGAKDKIIGLEPFDNPRGMEPKRNDDLSVRYEYALPNGGTRTFRQDEIFHLRGLSTDGLKGISVIEAAASAVGLAINAEKHGAKILTNGANVGGVLEHPGLLTPEAVTRLRETFDSIYSGAENAGKTVLLEEGLKFSKVGMTADEAQFIESRKFQRSDIGMFFGVPPHMYGDIERGTSWGSGIEQQGVGFVTYTLLPWLTNIALNVDCSLLTDEEQDRFQARFDTDPLTRADFYTRQQGRDIQLRAGVLSPDEWRRAEGMGPRPDGKGKEFSTSAPPAARPPQPKRPGDNGKGKEGEGEGEGAPFEQAA